MMFKGSSNLSTVSDCSFVSVSTVSAASESCIDASDVYSLAHKRVHRMMASQKSSRACRTFFLPTPMLPRSQPLSDHAYSSHRRYLGWGSSPPGILCFIYCDLIPPAWLTPEPLLLPLVALPVLVPSVADWLPPTVVPVLLSADRDGLYSCSSTSTRFPPEWRMRAHEIVPLSSYMM